MKTNLKLCHVIMFLLACAAMTSQLSRAEMPLPSGAVGYWPGDGDALDHAGTNHGVLEMGASFAPGWIRDGFSFTNVQDIKIPYSPTLARLTNCSIQAWLKPVGAAADKPWMMIFGQRGGPYSLQAVPGFNGGWRLELCQYSGGWHVAFMAGEIPTNQFTHVVVTWNGNTAAFYTNGIFCSQSSLPLYQAFYTDSFFIGGCNATVGPDGNFCGVIDEVAIWNRILSPEEIASLATWRMQPQIVLMKAVRPAFSDLYPGTNYQLQVSTDLNNWTNHGAVFTATNSIMAYPEFWDVDDWSKLFFRLQVSP